MIVLSVYTFVFTNNNSKILNSRYGTVDVIEKGLGTLIRKGKKKVLVINLY